MSTKAKIGFLGAGKMAEGILSAFKDKSVVIMGERNLERAIELKDKYGVKVVNDLTTVVRHSRLIFLCVRPQDVDAVADAVRPVLTRSQTLVSIVAGKSLAKLRIVFGREVRLVRVMPNLALRANAGMCAICAASGTSPSAVEQVRTILAGAGEAIVLKEKLFDAVTALSGSGPAYFAYMEQAMAEGGVALGLRSDVARLLAEQTMYGTAKFLRESKMPLKDFIAGVCTRGGTTAAGMAELSKPAFKTMVAKTLKAAARRSFELR